MDCWQLLQIEPTKDKVKIEQAYKGLVNRTRNYEDFEALLNALKVAFAYCEDTPQVKVVSNTIVDLEYKEDIQKSSIVDADEMQTQELLEDINVDSAPIENISSDNDVDLDELQIEINQNKEVKNEDIVEVDESIYKYNDDITIENKREELLSIIRSLSFYDKGTIDFIFLDSTFVELLKDKEFKKVVEKQLIVESNGASSETIELIKMISSYYHLNSVERMIENMMDDEGKIGKVAKWVLCFAILIVYIFLRVAIRKPLYSSSSGNDTNDYSHNTINKDSAQARSILEMNFSIRDNEIRRARQENVEDFAPYLYGVEAIVNDKQIQISYQGNIYIYIYYTNTKYLVLENKDVIDILDCETKTFLSSSYKSARALLVLIDDVEYYCAIVRNQAYEYYILEPEGNFILIPKELDYGYAVLSLKIDNGEVKVNDRMLVK